MKRFDNINELQLEYVDEWITSISNPTGVQGDIGNEIKLKFNIRINRGIEKLANKARIKVHVLVTPEEEPEGETGVKGEFLLGFVFEVNSLSDYMSFEDGSWHIDPTLSGTLISTAYSTARGIVYSKCKGSPLGSVLMPIISVQDLMDLADSGQIYQ